jgi:hypothetical protein
MPEPTAERPYIAHAEYGIPKDKKTLVPWSWVAERFTEEVHYWIAAASPDGTPTARPVWGVFVDNAICFGGGPKTRWSRFLEANPKVSLHLESGEQGIIAEGEVDRVTDADDPFLTKIDDAYEIKYKMRHGPPVWVLRPTIVLAWTEFPKTMTRFRF